MKGRTIHVAAGFMLWGTSLIYAQTNTVPHMLRIYREDIKEGKSLTHERIETGYVRAFQRSGYPSYIAYQSLTGTSQAWFVERHDSYDSIEKAMQMALKDPLKSLLDTLDAQDGEVRSGSRGMIATYRPELSYEPVPPIGAKVRFSQINVVRIHQGHVAEFAELRKMANGAFAKSGSQRRFVVFQVNSGMPAGTYLITSLVDSLKMLDAPTMPGNEAFGSAENYTRYEKMLSDLYVSSESTLFAVNPKMSNPPKDYLTADPDFWAPKPKTTAAVAKPTAKSATQQ